MSLDNRFFQELLLPQTFVSASALPRPEQRARARPGERPRRHRKHTEGQRFGTLEPPAQPAAEAAALCERQGLRLPRQPQAAPKRRSLPSRPVPRRRAALPARPAAAGCAGRRAGWGRPEGTERERGRERREAAGLPGPERNGTARQFLERKPGQGGRCGTRAAAAFLPAGSYGSSWAFRCEAPPRLLLWRAEAAMAEAGGASRSPAAARRPVPPRPPAGRGRAVQVVRVRPEAQAGRGGGAGGEPRPGERRAPCAAAPLPRGVPRGRRRSGGVSRERLSALALGWLALPSDRPASFGYMDCEKMGFFTPRNNVVFFLIFLV